MGASLRYDKCGGLFRPTGSWQHQLPIGKNKHIKVRYGGKIQVVHNFLERGYTNYYTGK